MSAQFEMCLIDSAGGEAPLDMRHLRDRTLPIGSLIAISGRGQTLSQGLLRFARTAVSDDPRIATISDCDSALAGLSGSRRRIRLAAPFAAPGGTVYASAPAGSLVVLNPAVFDLVGWPQLADGRAQAIIADITRWSALANHRGLRHLWRWSGGSEEEPPLFAPAHLDVLEAGDSASPIGLLADQHRAAHDALTIGVDASWLDAHETGAQVATVHWLAALAQRTDVAELRLHRLPRYRLPEYAAHLAGLPAVRIADDQESKSDIFWRPYQPDRHTNVSRDRDLGRRLVTTVLDLIDHSNEFYHSDIPGWSVHRRALRNYLTKVDMVTAISDDVLRHVLMEVPGIGTGRVRETALGVDHLLSTHPVRPPLDILEAWPGAADARFLLVLGNDFMHKNRDFAIRVWQSVAESVDIDLVLAGLHVGASSTKLTEDILLGLPPRSPAMALRLEHVSPGAKKWLLANAAVVLYPSSAEGFGFIPHEAATLGSVSLGTNFGPLGEFLPDEVLTRAWSVGEYSDRILKLLGDEQLRSEYRERVLRGVPSLTWDASAETLTGVFRCALTLAPKSTGRRTLAYSHGPDVDPELALEQLTSSLSWRVTRPLRAAALNARRVRARLREGA